MENTVSIDKCLARQLAALAIDCLKPDLTGEKYYEAEDELTKKFNDKIYSNLSQMYWEDQVFGCLQCLDRPIEEVDKLCSNENLIDGIVNEIQNSNSIWDDVWNIIDWHLNELE